MNTKIETSTVHFTAGTPLVAPSNISEMIQIGHTEDGNVILLATANEAEKLVEVLYHYKVLAKSADNALKHDADLLEHIGLSLLIAIAQARTAGSELANVTYASFRSSDAIASTSPADDLTKIADATAEPPPGVCRFCGCTDYTACEGPFNSCYWIDDTHTVCSSCRGRMPRVDAGIAPEPVQ